jgi:hypothetical protein
MQKKSPIHNGEQGYIVPVSSVSTDGYSSLQDLLGSMSVHYSSFDDRPSRLFDGLQHIRLTIHLIHKEKDKNGFYATRYNKWYSEERDLLFSNLVYAERISPSFNGSWGKVSDKIERCVYDKISVAPTACTRFANRGNGCFYYSRKVGYFMQVLQFKPRVVDGDGALRDPSEFKAVFTNSAAEATALASAFNSNLFYWYLTVFSDCRHVNKREIDAFPVGWINSGDSMAGVEKIATIGTALMEDLGNNSEDRQMTFKHDTLTVQCIIPKKSKPLIDEIDKVLAEHYSLTDEELDTIINYDIKYRMGKDLQEEGSDE